MAGSSHGAPFKMKGISPLRQEKKGVTRGDVLQTLAYPHLNIKKTLGVVKHYAPPKVKTFVSKSIKKGKYLAGKVKKYLSSPA